MKTKVSLPTKLRWLFWEVDPKRVDLKAHADYVIARVLEHGRMKDVEWVLSTYGDARVHSFFRDVGHPELSARTVAFWRAYFEAKDESWARPAPFRKSSSAPWID